MARNPNIPLKLLITTPLYPPEIGGPATYVALLERELKNYGFELHLLKFRDVRKYPKGIRHVFYFFQAYRLMGSVDLILTLDPVSVGWPTMLAAKLRGKPYVVRIAGDYAWEQGQQRFGITDPLDVFAAKTADYPWSVRWLKKIQTKVARRAVKIIVPSKYLQDIVMAWGIDRSRIVVIYNAFTKEYEPVSKKELRVILNLTSKIIFSAGRLVPWKGFDTLIRLMPRLLERLPDLKLYIAGDGPDRDRLKLLATAEGVEEQIVFLGQLGHIDLLKYGKAADIFVLNTAYEGFSHQLLEIMSLGVPIITTRVGGNPELIDQGRSGLLVKVDDKQAIVDYILTLFDHPAEATKIGTHGLEKVAEFTEERLIKETASLLTSLI